jgi:hypothetical protein
MADDSTNTASRPAPSSSTITGINHHDLTLKKANSSLTVLILLTNLRKLIPLAGQIRLRMETQFITHYDSTRAARVTAANAIFTD